MMEMGTIIAMRYEDGDGGGVVLAADSRTVVKLEGSSLVHIRSENVVKILKLTKTIYVCVAGKVADFYYVYCSFHDALRSWMRMYNRTESSFSVREVAGLVSWAIAQDMGKGVDCIVGGWDIDGGAQIYFVTKEGVITENLNFKYSGSGYFVCDFESFKDVFNSGASRERTKEHVLACLEEAALWDPYTGGQKYTVTIDKTNVVREVLSVHGEVIPNWAWM